MELSRYKLGELIELVNEKNTDGKYDESYVRGVNNRKKLMPTKVNLIGRNLNKFQIVHPGLFVFNHRTSRNGSKFSIAYNDEKKTIICTEDYVVFRVRDNCKNILNREWLYIFFNRPEFDRFVITNSWGSSTEFYNWENICDISIDLPPLAIQQKYVNVYNAMVANQRAYERGLEDLKLTCDAYIEDLRRRIPCEAIGPYIERHDVRNGPNGTKNVMGVSTTKEFREPTSKVNRNDLANYKVVKPRQISFVQTTHNEKVFCNALNTTDEDIVVTSVNEVFSTNENKLLPEYLVMFFNRTEFDRYARYHSWGSARETFTWDDLVKVQIPIADMEVQRSIVDIYTVYKKRKAINEKLKAQIKAICPILIKGSIEEGSNTKEA